MILFFEIRSTSAQIATSLEDKLRNYVDSTSQVENQLHPSLFSNAVYFGDVRSYKNCDSVFLEIFFNLFELKDAQVGFYFKVNQEFVLINMDSNNVNKFKEINLIRFNKEAYSLVANKLVKPKDGFIHSSRKITRIGVCNNLGRK